MKSYSLEEMEKMSTDEINSVRNELEQNYKEFDRDLGRIDEELLLINKKISELMMTMEENKAKADYDPRADDIMAIKRNIVSLRNTKKDLQIAQIKAKHNVKVVCSDMRVLERFYWKAKNLTP